MKELRTILIEYYLNYVNNYLSVDRFAEHNGLTLKQALDFIGLAQEIFLSIHPEE